MSIRRELKHKSSRSQLRVRSDLLEAVKKGELIKIEKMLRKGEINQADLSIKDDSGNTCMLLALRNDHREVFVRILQEDVGVNTADNNNITPLHLICSKGWIECVNLLVKKGANVNAQDSKGNTPLH
jgi:ankyrin repeat protein